MNVAAGARRYSPLISESLDSSRWTTPMPIYEGHGFRIERAGWGLEDGEETLTLTPADIDAALQVTAFTSSADTIDDDDLRELAGSGTPQDIIRTSTQCGAFRGYRAAYNQEATHWRVWWLASGRTHLYVTHGTHFDTPEALRGALAQYARHHTVQRVQSALDYQTRVDYEASVAQ